jgi:hypothetical protein
MGASGDYMSNSERCLAVALIAGTDLAAGTAYYTEGADWILYALAGIFIALAIRIAKAGTRKDATGCPMPESSA